LYLENKDEQAATRAKIKAIIKYVMDTFYISLFVGVAIFSYLFSIYWRFLPLIPSSFFQMLIQVIATLIGFIIVAAFYYLAKIDEIKKEYIKDIIKISQELKQQRKFIDTNIKNRNLNPTYGAPIKLGETDGSLVCSQIEIYTQSFH
jgi:glucan phosphoethanolaminetransferase (alkaline phosphatase superfamily)